MEKFRYVRMVTYTNFQINCQQLEKNHERLAMVSQPEFCETVQLYTFYKNTVV